VPCPHCAATATAEQPRRTALGYRTFRGEQTSPRPLRHIFALSGGRESGGVGERFPHHHWSGIVTVARFPATRDNKHVSGRPWRGLQCTSTARSKCTNGFRGAVAHFPHQETRGLSTPRCTRNTPRLMMGYAGVYANWQDNERVGGDASGIGSQDREKSSSEDA